MVIDKASITLAQTCYLAIGLLYAMGHLPLLQRVAMGLESHHQHVLLGLLGFIASAALRTPVTTRLPLSRLQLAQAKLQQLSQRLAPLDAQLRGYYTAHPWRFGGSLLLHFVGFIAAGSKTYVLLRLLLGTQAPGWSEAMLVAVVVAALDQMFFLVPARLGTLEGTRVLVLSRWVSRQRSGSPLGSWPARKPLLDGMDSSPMPCAPARLFLPALSNLGYASDLSTPLSPGQSQ